VRLPVPGLHRRLEEFGRPRKPHKLEILGSNPRSATNLTFRTNSHTGSSDNGIVFEGVLSAKAAPLDTINTLG
jgi:hypothetical protein